MAPLIPDSRFADILEVLNSQTVGLVRNRFGNVGDQLIQRGTLALFARHGIRCQLIEPGTIDSGIVPPEVTLIAEPGGGNLGTRPTLMSPARRQKLARCSCPKIVLPQTASDEHEDLSQFDVVFAREQTTFDLLSKVHKKVRLVPDLALSLPVSPSTPIWDEGVFLRDDAEKTTTEGVDPVGLARNADEYLLLAGNYRHVITNRLHFAIAALLRGQTAILKPNSYHKNRSFYDTWFRDNPNIQFQE